MSRIFLCVCLSFFLLSCTTTGEVSEIQRKLMNIKVGMSKGDVVELFGKPGNRSFNGNKAVWQYCQTGMFTDTYATIWFIDNKVQALSNYNATAEGLCTGYFQSVDWLRPLPKGGTHINVDINLDNSKSK